MILNEKDTDAILHSSRVQTNQGNPVSSYYVAWDEFGTRYRLLLTPLAGLGPEAWEDLGCSPLSIQVTLWPGSNGRSALFKAGTDQPLVDAYIGEKLRIRGEDLEAIGRKLRPLLRRPG
jgi:hypothetical protein